MRKLCDLNAVPRPRVVVVTGRTRHEGVLATEIEPEQLHAGQDRFAKAIFVDRWTRLLAVVPPILEPSDQDRMVQQIDHGAGAKGRHELADAEPPIRGS